MEFKTYLDKMKIKPYKFAQKHGIPSATVWRAYKGVGCPDGMTIMAIADATKGNVKLIDWRHLRKPRRRP